MPETHAYTPRCQYHPGCTDCATCDRPAEEHGLRVHDLKVDARWFPDVLSGKKPFELRKDDRGYQVGDVLVLREWDRERGGVVDGPSGWPELSLATFYTGRTCRRTVTCILRHEDFEGIAPGYAALGLAKEGAE